MRERSWEAHGTPAGERRRSQWERWAEFCKGSGYGTAVAAAGRKDTERSHLIGRRFHKIAIFL